MSQTDPYPPIAVKASTAAKMLDCSRQYIYVLAERGVLRRLTIGDSTTVRIPLEDIYAALNLDAPERGDAA